jgi:hypothetical protein
MKSKVTSAIAEASRSLDTDFDVQITGRAVRNALHEHGMEPRNKINEPRHSPKNARDRFDFAKNHLDWNDEKWDNVIWSDETKICRFGSSGGRMIWVKEGEELKE